MKALNSGKVWFAVVLAIFSMSFAYAQPANDACSGAIALTCGQTITASNATATNDAVPACGLSAPRKGVWYTITGTGGLITLSTCSATTNFDTQIAVYTGACGALTCVTSNDNAAACTNFFGRLSTVSFNSTFGTVYRIMVSGKLSASGTFTLAATCAVVAPPNDDCAGATPLTVGTSCTFSQHTNVGATASAGAPAPGCASYSGGDVWFSAVVPANGRLILDSQPGATVTDAGMALYTGTCGALTLVECDDDDSANGLMPLIDRSGLTPGSTVYIRMWEFGNNAFGTFGVCAHSPAPPPPGDNDACDPGVPTIACGGSVSGTTATATTDAVGTCVTTLNTAPGRWYRFIGTGQSVTLTTCNPGTNYDTKLGVFTGTCGALTCVTGNDDQDGVTVPACVTAPGSTFNRASTVTFTSVSGTTYYILVTGFSTFTGTYTLTASCVTTLSAEEETLPEINQNLQPVPGALNVGQLFPNPVAGGNVSVRIDAPTAGFARLNVVDNMGRAVRTMDTELYTGANTVELNINNLAVGTYFVSIQVGNEVVRRKLLIVRP